jgi:phosphatidylglycerophosphate synthase
MGTIPKRIPYLTYYRKPLAIIEKVTPRLPLNANQLSVVGLLLTLLFPFVGKLWPYNILLLTIILLVDFLDGVQARREVKTEQAKNEGYIIDVTFDRLSDCITTIIFIDTIAGKILFTLSLTNILLNYLSMKKNIHYSFAIRFFLIIYLIYLNYLA